MMDGMRWWEGSGRKWGWLPGSERDPAQRLSGGGSDRNAHGFLQSPGAFQSTHAGNYLAMAIFLISFALVSVVEVNRARNAIFRRNWVRFGNYFPDLSMASSEVTGRSTPLCAGLSFIPVQGCEPVQLFDIPKLRVKSR
jgi:hypothetical protein